MDGMPVTALALPVAVGALVLGRRDRRRLIAERDEARRMLDELRLPLGQVTTTGADDDARQDFVATVSHELRTPLTPLKGFLVMLTRQGFEPTAAERAVFYDRMLDQVRRLERLVQDLLSVSQLERGSFTIDQRPVRLHDVIGRVVHAASSRVAALPGDEDAIARADADRVEQVLHNLVCNAEKYTPAEAAIAVSAAVVGGEVVVTVADQGPGIAVEDREVIFERFQRLANGSGPAAGSGLGLYVARRLVEAMAGRIWVDGEPGSGARFHFTLPLAGRAPRAAPEPVVALG